MAFQPFQSELADHRVVRIPSELDADHRARFVAKVAAAVKQQASLAKNSSAILRVAGDVDHQGDLILIPHELAAPLDSTRLEESEEHPDINTIWWLTWVGIDALKAAAAAGAPHGGIQSGALYQDECGRVKLGDFGIAPSYEAICGLDKRAQVHCDGHVDVSNPARKISGTWSLLSEDASRDAGWIAPYFAHELLEGKLRLNPKSDQFAYGALLFLLATGSHPYGASLSDPTISVYFHLEPYEVRDERGDWEEVFERLDKDLSGSADKPIVAWSDFIRKLLASDPGERFPNPAEAEKIAADFMHESWTKANSSLDSALEALDSGDADTCLEHLKPCAEDEDLPELWRSVLTPWAQRIESQKAAIGKLKQLRKRLIEANQALDEMDMATALAAATEVAETPEADEALKLEAGEIIKACEEQEQFVQSGADQISEAYLQSADECIAEERFADARQILEGILQDPATPPPRESQARERLTTIELIEQRGEHQVAELTGATEDMREGRYGAARQRLEALLAEDDVPEAVTTQAKLLLDDITKTQERRAKYVSALDEARNAWERSDVEEMGSRLADVPEDFADPDIAGMRSDLVSRMKPLRQALERRGAVQEKLAAGDHAGALKLAEHDGANELPQLLKDEFAEIATQCREALAEQRAELVTAAGEALDKAEAAWTAGKADDASKALKDVATDLGDKAIDKRRAELAERVEQLQSALALREKAEKAFAADNVEEALKLALEASQTPNLPDAPRGEIDALAEKCRALIEERHKAAIEQAQAALKEANTAFDEGRCGECAEMLRELVLSEIGLPAEDRKRGESLAKLCERAAAIEAALPEARKQAKAGRFDEALKSLNQFDTKGLPAAVVEPLEKAQQEIESAKAERLAKLAQEIDERIDAVARDIETGKLDGAEDALAEIESSDTANKQHKARIAKTLETLATVQPIANALRAAESALDDDDAAKATKLLKRLPDTLPGWASERVEAVQTRAADVADKARRNAIKDAGATLDAAQKALDACEAKEARAKLDAAKPSLELDAVLGKRYEKIAAGVATLEEWLPKVTAVEKALAGGDVAGAHRDAAALQKEADLPAALKPRVDELLGKTKTAIKERRQAIDAELAALAEELERRKKRAKNFVERAEALKADALSSKEQRGKADELIKQYNALPEPKMPIMPLAIGGAIVVVAIVGGLFMFGGGGDKNGNGGGNTNGGTSQGNGGATNGGGGASQSGNGGGGSQQTVTDADLIADALTRLQGELADAADRAAAEGRETPAWQVEFTPSDSFATTAHLVNGPDGASIELGQAENEGQLAALSISSVPVDDLFPQPPPVTPTLAERMQEALSRLQSEIDAAREAAAEEGRPAPQVDVRFADAETLPSDLIATFADTNEEMTLASISESQLDGLHLRNEWRDALYPPQAPLADRMSAALARVQAELDEARKAIAADGREAPAYTLRFADAENLPTNLIAASESGTDRILAQVDESQLPTLALQDAWRDELYPPVAPLTDRMADALARVQAQVAQAQKAESAAGRAAPAFTLRFADARAMPTDLIATNGESGAEVKLGTIDEADLETLALRDEWRNSLYPPPMDVAQAQAQFKQALQTALPASVQVEAFQPNGQEQFAVSARWNSRPLVNFDGLQADAATGRFEPTAEQVARHFAIQAAALEAFDKYDQPIPGLIKLDPAYDANWRVRQQAKDITLVSVDDAAGTVTLSMTMRLADDTRSAADFTVTGAFDGTALTADEQTRAAFGPYVRKLQVDRLPNSLGNIDKVLNLPAGLSQSTPGDFTGGDTVTLRVETADRRLLAEVPATWNPASLLYEADAATTAQALRDGVRKQAAEPATVDALRAAWPDARVKLTPDAGATGRGYIERSAMTDAALSDAATQDPFAAVFDVSIAPPGAGEQDQITFPLTAGLANGAFAWRADDVAATRDAIAKQLNALAGDAAFHARRQSDAVAQLATELGVDAATLSPTVDGDALSVDVSTTQPPATYAWTWDAGQLAFANRTMTAKAAPATVDSRLAALADQSAVTAEELIGALADVTNAKLEKFAASAYVPLPALSADGDPAARLADISRSLQKLMSPDPKVNPFPTVFIEYYVGDKDVFALSWKAQTDASDAITSVSEPAVRRVMGKDELAGYANAEAFRASYSTNAALGEKMFGSMLGSPIKGSAGGAFGVAVAPDGLLWMTRWEQVAFNPRPVQNVATRGADDPGTVNSLRNVLRGVLRGREDWRYPRAGVWCVPALAAEWTGRTTQINLRLGDVLPGKQLVARYKDQGKTFFAPILDANLSGDLFGWQVYAPGVTPGDIGTTFWGRGWDGNFQPTPYTSFSLILRQGSD